MSGKGDIRRPMKIDGKTFAKNWERIFGKPKILTKQPESNICCVCGFDYSLVMTDDGKCLCDRTDCPCLKIRD